MLESMPWLWTEPNYLPLIFVRTYVERARLRASQFNDQMAELDADLGVNQAGRVVAYPRALESWPSNLPFKDLMSELYSLHNRIIHGQQFLLWGRRCLSFLLDLEGDIQTGFLDSPHHLPSDEIKESMAYEISLINVQRILSLHRRPAQKMPLTFSSTL